MEIFISRKLQCGVTIALVFAVTIIVGSVVVTRTQPQPAEKPEKTLAETPEEILKLYVRLALISKSLQKSEEEVRKLDEIIRNNRTTMPIEEHLTHVEEFKDMQRGYFDAASEYNRTMKKTQHRFSDPANLPVGAVFGPLPREFPLFVRLAGPRF